MRAVTAGPRVEPEPQATAGLNVPSQEGDGPFMPFPTQGKPPSNFLFESENFLPSSSPRLYDLRINKEVGDVGKTVQNQQEQEGPMKLEGRALPLSHLIGIY